MTSRPSLSPNDTVMRHERDPGDTQNFSAASAALQIANFLARTELERLLLFRLHLQTTIRRVSPLLLDLAVRENISLTNASALIYPPQDWPGRPFFDVSPVPIWRMVQKNGWRQGTARRERVRFERMFANPGVIIRQFDDPRGRFGIRPCRSVLGFTAAMGSCVLTAFGSTGILKLGDQLPQTVMTSLKGHRLGDIVEHPIFAGRDYLIRRAMHDPADDMPVLAFHAKTIAYKGTWV